MVRIFAPVRRLSGKSLLRREVLPNNAVREVGKDRADPWVEPSLSRILGPITPKSGLASM
jgi:hypothetical protein